MEEKEKNKEPEQEVKTEQAAEQKQEEKSRSWQRHFTSFGQRKAHNLFKVLWGKDSGRNKRRSGNIAGSGFKTGKNGFKSGKKPFADLM